MNEMEKNLEDVEFILSAVRKHLKHSPQDLRAALRGDPMHLFYRIHRPGQREFLIGAEGHRRLSDLGRRFLTSRKDEKAKTDLDEFVPVVGEELVRIFVLGGQEATSPMISKTLARAYKRIAKIYEPITHYIPCAMISSVTLKRFMFGPIEFIPISDFLASNREEFDRWAEDSAKEAFGNEESRNSLSMDEFIKGRQGRMEGLIRFFRQFAWVAQVAIPDCVESVSRRRALLVTRSALNAMKLIFGAEYSDRFRTSEDFGCPVESFQLARRAGGKLELASRYILNGNPFEEGWMEILDDKMSFYSELLQSTLEISITFNKLPHLGERFLSALSWYGDAVSEPVVGAKIVKYVSAIESMVGTGPEVDDDGKELRGVTLIVSSRAAIFYACGLGLKYDEAQKEISKIYSTRSKLVHGSISPFDESLPRVAFRAGNIARMVLLVGLDFFNSKGLESIAHSAKTLKGQFDTLEKEEVERTSKCE